MTDNAIIGAEAHREIWRLVQSYVDDVAEMVGYFADVDANEPHDTERPPAFPEPDTFGGVSRTLHDFDEILQSHPFVEGAG